MDESKITGASVLERMRELPGGRELLDLSGGREDVELVGGASRDLLLGLAPRELDVVVGDDARSFAGELAARLALPAEGSRERSGTTVHERFGTAVVWWEGGRIDIASRRGESYPAPGALPQVRAGTPEEDLRRRDFTVNAIAVPLGEAGRGALRTVPHALADLAAGQLRVLHEQSFLDDPTRLLRLARYSARLGFTPQARTGELAAAALAAGALATVSLARVGAELRLALTEPEPVPALAALGDLGVLSALDPPLGLERPLAARALAILPQDARPDLLLLGCLLLADRTSIGEDLKAAMLRELDEMEFPAGDRDRALATALLAPPLHAQLAIAASPSQVRAAVGGAPPEAVALAGALGDEHHLPAAAAARRWLGELRHVRLEISGDDLLAAGIPAGPEVGRRLERALERKLDGELADGREWELDAALEGS
jgi:tRNA nucleotidyltransferase (CCA-adding enzyme)